MSKLKVAIVGTGLIAKKKHIPAWQALAEQADLAAICDSNLELGKKVAAEHHIERAYGDLGEMLERERPDVVDICTPPRSHADLAVRCLRAGAHVLVEKPMAVSPEECDRMIAAAREAKREMCVVHSDLFYPSFMQARQFVAEGRIGELRGMRIFLSTPTDYITSNPEHWANKLPGGVIGETGPHVVYMTLAFINPIAQVLATGRKMLPQFPWSPYEDYRIELAGEAATASIALTYATNQWAAQVDLWGERGMIHVDIESQVVSLYDRPDLAAGTIGRSAVLEATQALGSVARAATQVIAKRFASTHEQIMAKFCAALREGGAPPVSSQEGREAVRVMDLITLELDKRAG